MGRPNIFEPELGPPDTTEGFRDRRAWVGADAGASRLAASVFELPPGQSAVPYHYHLREEELLVVLRGRPWLRDPSGWSQLEEGDVVAFPVGEAGAHQLLNRSSETVRVMIASQMKSPEICVYPDSGKVGVFDKSFEDGSVLLPLAAAMDYFDGERPPEVPE